jgi:hypothetical protein
MFSLLYCAELVVCVLLDAFEHDVHDFRCLHIARKALLAQPAALNTIGHDLANVATSGYTRQRAELIPLEGIFKIRADSIGSRAALTTEIQGKVGDANALRGQRADLPDKIRRGGEGAAVQRPARPPRSACGPAQLA